MSFTGVYSTNVYVPTKNPQTALVWSFTLTALLAKLSATFAQIRSAQQSISANNSGLTLTLYVAGTQVSPQLQQSQPCSQSALLADAQAQAKQVAAAAGVSAGPILSLAEGGGPLGASLQVASAQLVAGDFFAGVPSISAVLTTPAPTCSLTVQFQLM